MPASSERQAHVARMAMGLKKGSLDLDEIPEGAREAVRNMARMSERSLHDFMHTREKPKKKTLLD